MMYVFAHTLLCLILLNFLPVTQEEVVDKFDTCKDFFVSAFFPKIPGILEDGTIKNQNRYKAICQYYNGKYRFATLYDTDNKIPVFSAYKFTGTENTGARSAYWFIEPQKKIKMGDEIRTKIYPNQATDEDYKDSAGFDRGHLLPRQYATDEDTADSTFTLTNIVPQKSSFNQGSWREMEEHVVKIMMTDCKDSQAYVLIGAVPGENKLKNRVIIPKMMWTAFCCETKSGKWLSGAYWGYNTDEQANIQLEQKSVNELQLTEDFSIGIQIFPEQCLTM
ncbi:endonuclease domain-containing 1 protein-like [Scleropages formosus]|uniref:Endonuclease domain-containing 1 protein-like n=1 Tax=Scleropages formosus TaxID=113540 RepID=A0A0P7UCT9_SCLFO|nr:endonuclease domain-containing 1 protein-like [Scleropages formosus]